MGMSDVTQILQSIETGDPNAANQLLPLVYEEFPMIELNKKIERIFSQATEIELKEAREAFVRGACDGDDKLRKGVEELLLAFDDMGDIKFLKTEAERQANNVPTLAEVPLSEGPGTMIGRYKMLQQIGEGGMGVVYMAQQTEPVNRKVALKIIKLGMDTKQVVARFEAERQALAMMTGNILWGPRSQPYGISF